MSTQHQSAAADDISVVFCTCPPADAARLAKFLVEGRHAACVNVLPAVTSIYEWEGEICEDTESLLVAKIRARDFESLRSALADTHPYDVPEIIALPVAAGHPPYVRWVLGAGSSA